MEYLLFTILEVFFVKRLFCCFGLNKAYTFA